MMMRQWNSPLQRHHHPSTSDNTLSNANNHHHRRHPQSSSMFFVGNAGNINNRKKWFSWILVLAISWQIMIVLQIPKMSILIMESSLSSSSNSHMTMMEHPILHKTMVSQQQQQQQEQSSSPTRTTPEIFIKVRVGYVISVTHCNWELIEAAAIHGHSIDLVHDDQTNYTIPWKSSLQHHHHHQVTLMISHTRYAMVHPEAQACVPILRDALSYQTQIHDIPLTLDSIQSKKLRQDIHANNTGCCGAKELLKLYAYTLDQEDVVIHLDTDVLMLQIPLHVMAAMMLSDTEPLHHLGHIEPLRNQSLSGRITPNGHHQDHVQNRHDNDTMIHTTPTSSSPNFFFTRDYLSGSNIHQDPDKFAVQGGMFILRPNRTVFEDLLDTIRTALYTSQRGWGRQGFGGYWGAPQVQGLLSYYYYLPLLQDGTAIELNRCYYNNMGVEAPRWYNVPRRSKVNGQCTTMQPTCQDCRNVSLLPNIYFAHFTMCNKPWKCLRRITDDDSANQNLCYPFLKAWFAVRESLEQLDHPTTTTRRRIRWPLQLQSRLKDRPFWSNATLSYCTNPNLDNHANNNNNNTTTYNNTLTTRQKKYMMNNRQGNNSITIIADPSSTAMYRPIRGLYHPLVFLNLSALLRNNNITIPKGTITKNGKVRRRPKKSTTLEDKT